MIIVLIRSITENDTQKCSEMNHHPTLTNTLPICIPPLLLTRRVQTQCDIIATREEGDCTLWHFLEAFR